MRNNKIIFRTEREGQGKPSLFLSERQEKNEFKFEL